MRLNNTPKTSAPIKVLSAELPGPKVLTKIYRQINLADVVWEMIKRTDKTRTSKKTNRKNRLT